MTAQNFDSYTVTISTECLFPPNLFTSCGCRFKRRSHICFIRTFSQSKINSNDKIKLSINTAQPNIQEKQPAHQIFPSALLFIGHEKSPNTNVLIKLGFETVEMSHSAKIYSVTKKHHKRI